MTRFKLKKIATATLYSVITTGWIVVNVIIDVDAWKKAIEAE